MGTFSRPRATRWALGIAIVALAAALTALLIPDHATAGLGGTSWRLVAYGPESAPVAAEAPATLEFESNGRMGGRTGCNQFFGNYRAEDGRLWFVDGLAFTTQDCDPATAEGAQDAFFRAHLPDGAGYEQTPDRLTLRFANGQMAQYTLTP